MVACGMRQMAFKSNAEPIRDFGPTAGGDLDPPRCLNARPECYASVASGLTVRERVILFCPHLQRIGSDARNGTVFAARHRNRKRDTIAPLLAEKEAKVRRIDEDRKQG